MSWCQSTSDGVVLNLQVVPRASRTGVGEALGDRLKIRLQAPPVEGKANRALLEFIAERLDLPKRALELEAGAHGRQKRLRVIGLDEATVRARLAVQ